MSEQAPTQIYEKDRPIFERLKAISEEQLLQEPVTALPFAVRAVNYFQRNNIETIGQIALCKKADLLKARNLGRKTVAHIAAYLKELGLTLSGDSISSMTPAATQAFNSGAQAMRLSVLAKLADLGVSSEVAQALAVLPLPAPEDA